MRKKLAFVLFTAFVVFLFRLPTHAVITNVNSPTVTKTGEYMVISGGEEDHINGTIYNQFYDNVTYYIDQGYMDAEFVFQFGEKTYNLVMHVEIQGQVPTVMKGYLDNALFYEASIEDDYIIVEYSKDLDFCYMNNDYTNRVKYKSVVFSGDYPFYDDYDQEDLPENLEDYFLSFLQGGDYHINEAYLGKEPHITMEYDATITMEDIVNSISVSDLTEGEISDFKIIDNTFPDESPAIGEYSFRVVAKDKSGNTTIQKFYVNVVDIKDPIITAEDFSVSYTKLAEENDIYSHIQIEDESDYTKSLNIDDYVDNYQTPGEYSVSVYVKDKYGNDHEEYFTITVIDDVPPVFGYANDIEVDTLTYYDIEYIRENYFDAVDEIDGSCKSKIVFTDLDDYATNYKTPGDYRFEATVEDNTGNPISVEFVIHSIDYDYPEIKINQYTVFVSEGEKMTKADIIEMLESLGRNIDNAEIDCAYFYEDSPSGVYDLTITYSDGTVITDRIITYVSNVSMDEPEKKEKKSYVKVIVFSSIGGAFVILFSVMGIIIYRKRH